MENSKKKLIILSSIIIGVLVVVLGISYAFYSYEKTGSNSQLVLGDIYMHYTEKNSLDLSGIMPSSTYNSSKYFEFTIDGKNTYQNNNIYYEILINHGDNHATKTSRIKDNLLKFTLVEIKNNQEIIVVDGKSFDEINNSKIWVNTIQKNTLSEVNTTYRLYMWISNETKICGGEVENCDYYIDTTNQSLAWDNVYASIKVDVIGDFEKKSYETDEKCFSAFMVYDEKHYEIKYVKAADLLDISNDPEKLAVCANYFLTSSDLEQGDEGYDDMYLLAETLCSGQTVEVDGETVDFQSLLFLMESGGVIVDYEYLENEGIITVSQTPMFIEINTNEPLTNIDKSQANIILVGYNDTYDYCGSDVIIPREIAGIGVKEIYFDVFNGKQLKSVNIPNSVTTIGHRAFANNQLKSIDIPNSVTSINDSAFANNQLASVNIPDSVTRIGSSAFANNQLTSVEIPDSVTSIGGNAFENNRLTSVEIPDGVTDIGLSAFENNQLTSVEIPDGVTEIDSSTFANNQLTSVEIPDGVTSIGLSAFENNRLTSVEIPDSVTSIGANAFAINQLKSIDIPNSLTSINDSAFENNQLKSIDIPNSVTEIGSHAFSYNELISVEIGSGIQYIGYGAFVSCKGSNENLESITFISRNCSEIKNIQRKSTDITKYFPWLSDSSPYYQEGYKAKIIGTDGECSY